MKSTVEIILYSESTQLYKNIQTMLLLFLISLLLDGASGAESDETVTVMEGDSVTLHTNLTEVQNDDTILWLFGPKDSILSQITRKSDLTSLFITDDWRFRGRLQVDQKTGSLTIRNTRFRHSGQYKLSISREKTTVKIFNVTVIGVVVETDGVKSVSVTEGDSVILQSDVSEVQRDVLIVWRFGDKGILLAKIDVENKEISLNDADGRFRDRLKLDVNGSLTIKNTRTTDSGLYEVQVRGRESSQRFHLSVNGRSPGLIAGIIVAALLVAAVVSSVVVYYRRKISELEKNAETIEEKKVADGECATLETKTDLQKDDKVQWWYQHDSNLIAEIRRVEETPGVTHDGFDERFRSKLVLNKKTGSLTINNTMNIHSGLYMLEISSNTRKIKKRFHLTVTLWTKSVKQGSSVILKTNIDIQSEDEILWTFGAENCLVVKADSGMTIGKKFIDRVELDKKSGSLTLKDMKNTDSGHFKLQIINSEETTFRRFKVNVTREQPNDSTWLLE
ncbi:uncharacterized protein LOC125254174 [Megalobrama amblycephala]|uniref:uncharacterized protein LOC125254174 n=1 Tax=Megalobrama amblycephala TaxID=75352 RepID=UPI002013E516|nr:uncharacterized protein LOC125254174 [Megalobrama amblycephala]